MSGKPDRAWRLAGRLWRDCLNRYLGEILVLLPILAAVALFGISYGLIMKSLGDALDAGDVRAAVAGAPLDVAGWFTIIVSPPLAIIAVTAARAVAIYSQAVLTQDLAQKVLRDLQNSMFARLTRADFARFAREGSGVLVSRLTNDINVIAEALSRSGQAWVRDALTLLGSIGLMLWLDWVMTLMVLGLFLISAPFLTAIAKRARVRVEAQQILMGRLVALLAESLGHPRFVRTYGLEAHEEERARAGFEDRRRAAMKLVHNRAPVEPLLEILGGLAFAAVLWVASWRMAAGALTIGDLLAMITQIAILAPAARALGIFNTILNEGLAALARVYRVLDETDAVVDAPRATPLSVTEGELKFEGVSFAYGEAPAIVDVSFTARRGETVAIVGASGAGKSTILNLIPRLYDPTAGTILIDGVDIRGVTLASLRRQMALVSQDAALFDDTIRANIALGDAAASLSQIEEAAKAAAAHDFITRLPEGYETRVGERGAALSGGERQRVALARAFLRDAPILLLDEATSALDAASEALVQDALARLAQGRTTIVVAHRLATVRAADRILVMDRGRVVETGRHEDLMAMNGFYARLARLQFEPAGA